MCRVTPTARSTHSRSSTPTARRTWCGRARACPFREPTKIWVQQLAGSGTSFAPGSTPHALLATSAAWEGNVIENPSMVRWNGKLYVFYSANEWVSANYAIGYAECASVLGPCTKITNNGPLLANRGLAARSRRTRRVRRRIEPADARLPLLARALRRLSVEPELRRQRHVHHAGPTPARDRRGGRPQAAVSPSYRCHKDRGVRSGLVQRVRSPPARSTRSRRVASSTPRTGIASQRFPVGQRKSISVKVRGVGGVPDDGRVSAVALNVTATDATLGGFLSVHPTDVGLAQHLEPEHGAGADRAQHRDREGRVRTGASASRTTPAPPRSSRTSWAGSTARASSGGSFSPLGEPHTCAWTHVRRSGARSAPTRCSCSSIRRRGATGVVMNVTADAPTFSQSFVTVWPTGQTRPNASSLNMVAGETAPNLVFAQLGAGNRVSFQNEAGTHAPHRRRRRLVGAAPGTGGNYTPVAPGTHPRHPRRRRRTAGQGRPGRDARLRRRPASAGCPANATSVVLNLTVTQPSAQTFVTAYPAGQPRPDGLEPQRRRRPDPAQPRRRPRRRERPGVALQLQRRHPSRRRRGRLVRLTRVSAAPPD